MTNDAIGQEIVIGEYYGYSKAESGFTRVITGKATSAESGKVTLGEIIEKTYFGMGKANDTPYRTVKSDRKRTLASAQVFHIQKHLMVTE